MLTGDNEAPPEGSPASSASTRSERIRTTSAVSMATPVPAPIATPRSAWARAGVSLTPSPTMAIVLPRQLQLGDLRRFVPGQDFGDVRVRSGRRILTRKQGPLLRTEFTLSPTCRCPENRLREGSQELLDVVGACCIGVAPVSDLVP